MVAARATSLACRCWSRAPAVLNPTTAPSRARWHLPTCSLLRSAERRSAACGQWPFGNAYLGRLGRYGGRGTRAEKIQCAHTLGGAYFTFPNFGENDVIAHAGPLTCGALGGVAGRGYRRRADGADHGARRPRRRRRGSPFRLHRSRLFVVAAAAQPRHGACRRSSSTTYRALSPSGIGTVARATHA